MFKLFSSYMDLVTIVSLLKNKGLITVRYLYGISNIGKK